MKINRKIFQIFYRLLVFFGIVLLVFFLGVHNALRVPTSQEQEYNQDKLSTVTCPEYQFDEFSKKYKDVGEHMDLINKE